MKYNVELTKGDWVEYGDAKVLVRPVPFSVYNTEEMTDPENLWKVFDYAVVNWKGFVKDDDKEMKCNNKNKRIVFDFDIDLRSVVFEKTFELLQFFGQSAKK